MIYQLYELHRAVLAPLGLAAEATRRMSEAIGGPFGESEIGRSLRAACELIERGTRHHRHVAFDMSQAAVEGRPITVSEDVVWRRPFCTLRRFARDDGKWVQRILIVSPLSGHFSALLNDAVATLVERFEVYVVDWHDARDVPLSEGVFDLDTYIDYLIEIFRKLDRELHIVAFSQSTVPALAATALLAQAAERYEPRSLTLVAGPLDTRVNTTPAQQFAAHHARTWYEAAMISAVPFGHAGAGRRVLPGFVQLAGYISHNLDRHLDAHWDFFGRLVRGDDAAADAHRRFYDRFFSVLDLAEDFFFDTLASVFQRHDLARGNLRWRGELVEPSAITRTALLTIEGGLDDVSAPGQTAVAQALCPNIPATRRAHYLEPEAGHLGLFYGHHWRQLIEPRIRHFIAAQS